MKIRTSRLLATTAAMTLLPAAAALAHPSFNPNAIPPGESIAVDLVVPHGCAPGGGMPDGEALPTIRLDLEHPDGVTVVPMDVDGWDAVDDGEAIVWSDAGGATTEPIIFPVMLTVEGEIGASVYLNAFQQCEGGESFRWIGTPDVEADYPAVLVELSEEAGQAAGHADMEGMDHGDDASDHDEMADDHADDDHADDAADHDEMADDHAEDDHADDDGHDAMADMDGEGTADAGAQALAGEEAEDGGIGVGIVIAILAVAALLVSGLVAVRRGKKAV